MIKTMLRVLPALAVLAFAPAAAAQQTPEQVVNTYFESLRAGDMARVSALTHPEALEEFKSYLLDLMSTAPVGEDMPLSADELRALPADSVYTLFMNGMGDGSNAEDMRELLARLEIDVLGQVARGDSIQYVVYEARGSFMETPVQQTAVITLRRDGPEWRIDPGEGLMNMLGAGIFTLMMSTAMQAGMASALTDPDN